MKRIGKYSQLTDFTTKNAGTAEWCKAELDGKHYFVKKFHSPTYPLKDIGLPEKMYNAGVAEFKEALTTKRDIYERLREFDQYGVLVVPIEVINFQFHICAIADFVVDNVSPEQRYSLSEWQRLVFMRTLTLALMNVHKAGIVHSDMKPDNILITSDKDGNCKLRLIDFDGSFFESNPPTDPEEVVGDPAFYAPEAYQLSMKEDVRLDHRIDIFALGIIFHYFWCGKLPNKPDGQTIGECLLRGGTVTFDESVPLVLKQLIQKMISFNPNDRIALKSVYDVLGVQIDLYPPPPLPPPSPEEIKQTGVRIEFCSESGEVLKYRTLTIPYGSKKVITAEDIEGYHLIGLKKKEIEVDSKGFTASPVTFTYKKDAEIGNKRGKKIFLIVLLLFIVYWIIMCSLSIDAHNNRQYSDAKQYMDMTPFFSTMFESTYSENETMLYLQGKHGSSYTSIDTPSVSSVAATKPVETVTAKAITTVPITPTPLPMSEFTINTNITYINGKTTVRWSDSKNAGPYTVAYEYFDGGTATQSSFWAGGDRSSSTTSSKYFTIDNLIPGHQYIIRVTDSENNTERKTIRLPNTSSFIDGLLKSSSIKILTEYRYRNSSGTISKLSKLNSSVMHNSIIHDGYEYGIRYEISVPKLSKSRQYFEQLFFYAPNGYAHTVVSRTADYNNVFNSASYWWDCIGGFFFEQLLEKNNEIPTGQYIAELYWDGMLVNRSNFYIE